MFLYCRLEKRLVHSHCCSLVTCHVLVARCICGSDVSCKSANSICPHGRRASWTMALKAAMWSQALGFDRHRPKTCGVRYAAVHREHVPSTSAPVYGLTVFQTSDSGLTCMTATTYCRIYDAGKMPPKLA